jgi:prepilin peptidase CpaA
MIEMILGLIAVAMLGRIAWLDFLTLRIRNLDVLALTALALVVLATRYSQTGLADLWIGLGLFALGFVFWALRMMGAGDAKLFFPIGILIGWGGAVTFAILLLPASLAALAMLVVGRLMFSEDQGIGRRLAEIRRVKGVPYAVPLFLAAGGTILLGLPWGA